jgi:hypothetical protein
MFDESSPAWPVPMVRVLLYVPAAVPLWRPVDFMLDTGASASVLNPTQALLQVGFRREQLTRPQRWRKETFRGIGNDVVEYVLDASYGWFFGDGSYRLIAGPIRVAPYSEQSARLPSLLGWDILQHFQISMNWRAKIITLDELDTP